ncbi:SH3 domain-containing protein [Arthrobacter sp. GN70]|uniref:SH3 domain-containing protein n=2 Tax=Arthrobacter TaxID=1663 RepID=A0A4R5KF31_9MICC|nr:SH3 domain-containing protein [Arthrobacter sp. GN70]TDF92857.1 SH3 domain-containing protein [Arthrobacter terricola]
MFTKARFKRVLAFGVVSAALIAASAAFAAPADAATGRLGRTYSLNVRSAPQLSASVVGTIPKGGSVTLLCYVRGANVQGPWEASNVWDRVDLGGGRTGYAADAFVITGSATPIVPPCDAAPAPAPTGGSREAKAVAYARSMIGNTSLGGWCEVFAARAYGNSFFFTNAISNYRWQAARGRIHADKNAPAGALVYYSSPRWDAGNGHVAISNGNGQVITTLELGQPISVKSISWPPGFLGWAYAP